MSTATVRGTVSGMAERANPAFAVAVVGVPAVALGYAVTVASIQAQTYVHVMAGILWTGIDLFMGAVLGPVVGGLDEETSADVFKRLTPKTTFLLPALALVTIAVGIDLALRIGMFPNATPWLALFTAANVIPVLLLIGWQFDAWRDPRWAVPFSLATLGSLGWVATTIGSLAATNAVILVALGIVTVLSVQGFGVLLPGEVRIYRQIVSKRPDDTVIATIGERNAKLAGVQGVFQLLLILDMVYLRYGGF